MEYEVGCNYLIAHGNSNKVHSPHLIIHHWPGLAVAMGVSPQYRRLPDKGAPVKLAATVELILGPLIFRAPLKGWTYVNISISIQ